MPTVAKSQPTNENRDSLRNTINRCKSRMEELLYQAASVVFLISRVGTSEQARKFLDELRNDPFVGSTVYASPDDLALKREAFRRSGDDTGYTALVSVNIELA